MRGVGGAPSTDTCPSPFPQCAPTALLCRVPLARPLSPLGLNSVTRTTSECTELPCVLPISWP